DARPTFGVRREDLIVKDVPRHVVADGRARYDRWALARHEARAAGGVASSNVQTASEWAAAGAPVPAMRSTDVRVGSVSDRRDGERPGGIAFGIVVHAVLAQVPFDSSRQTLEDVARAEARLLGLSDEIARSAADVAERFLRHELVSRALAAE